jgi:hypothetical protein
VFGVWLGGWVVNGLLVGCVPTPPGVRVIMVVAGLRVFWLVGLAWFLVCLGFVFCVLGCRCFSRIVCWGVWGLVVLGWFCVGRCFSIW